MNKASLLKINALIEKGFAERAKEDAKACSSSFLLAWEELQAQAPASYTDFSLLVADYNEGQDTYDWLGWIWDICEELEMASASDKDCIEQRLEFIQSFKKRFPDTSDEDLQEFLQRNLIKTNFLLNQQAAGEQAVKDFYEQFPHSVWGYIEWGDALLKRTTHPTAEQYAAILAIYKQGLLLDDDEDFMDILRRRIKKLGR